MPPFNMYQINLKFQFTYYTINKPLSSLELQGVRLCWMKLFRNYNIIFPFLKQFNLDKSRSGFIHHIPNNTIIFPKKNKKTIIRWSKINLFFYTFLLRV